MFLLNSCVSNVSKTVTNVLLKMSGSQAIWIEEFIFSQILEYCQYPLFWLLTGGGPNGHIIEIISEFLLGTQTRQCLGRKWIIGHQHLWLRSPCKVHLEKDIFRETGCMKSWKDTNTVSRKLDGGSFGKANMILSNFSVISLI